MNIIPALKKLAVLSALSLTVATHAQALTFAESSSTSAVADPYQAALNTDSSFDSSLYQTLGQQVVDNYTALIEGIGTSAEPTSFNFDASAQGRSLSMLAAGLSMITYIVMRRRIKL